MLRLPVFSKPDRGTNAKLFAVSNLHRDTICIFLHTASHTGTRILAVVDSATHAATPMLSLLSSSKPDRDTPMLSRLSSSKPRQDTDHSLSSFSKPHRQTDPSLLSCSKPDRGTDLSSVPSVKPDRGFNLSFFIRPATLGHLS